MKSLGVLILAGLFCAASAPAQYSMRTGALGGPAGARAYSRPLGGVGPGFNRYGSSPYRNGYNHGRYNGYPYGYSVWVPDYFDYLDYENQYGAPYGVPPDASAYGAPPQLPPTSQQPVIINQYFGAPPPSGQANGQQPPPDANTTSAPEPGDVIGTPQNYYLIAYKNHEVYTAIAYWLEDKTLHYVTTQNTHNQASLDLIDLDLTKTLNQRNDVPFSLPGH